MDVQMCFDKNPMQEKCILMFVSIFIYTRRSQYHFFWHYSFLRLKDQKNKFDKNIVKHSTIQNLFLFLSLKISAQLQILWLKIFRAQT